MSFALENQVKELTETVERLEKYVAELEEANERQSNKLGQILDIIKKPL